LIQETQAELVFFNIIDEFLGILPPGIECFEKFHCGATTVHRAIGFFIGWSDGNRLINTLRGTRPAYEKTPLQATEGE
jgi:hypothetical protein